MTTAIKHIPKIRALITGLSDKTPYKAESDGYVIATSTGAPIIIYSDASATPTTRVFYNDAQNPNVCFPIAKNMYWKTDGASSINWKPIK